MLRFGERGREEASSTLSFFDAPLELEKILTILRKPGLRDLLHLLLLFPVLSIMTHDYQGAQKKRERKKKKRGETNPSDREEKT